MLIGGGSFELRIYGVGQSKMVRALGVLKEV